jgi:ASC-1-like (ASCH) protein
MRDTIFLEYIMSGQKKYEGRVNGPACRAMRVGDHLQLFDRQTG